MRYLFIIQGEGRGHLTQAMTLERLLRENGHEVVEMLVGKSPSRQLPEFFTRNVCAPVAQFSSINFLPSHKNRKPSMVKSVLYNAFAFFRYFPSMRFLNRKIRTSGADVVVNFYEMLVGMTYMVHRIKVPQVSIGHQYLFFHKDFGIPFGHYPGHESLNLFSRVSSYGAVKRLALSFRPMPDDLSGRIRVVPPLLRREVLGLRNDDGSDGPGMSRGDYILGYMLNAGFSEDVLAWHRGHPHTELRFFWDNWAEGKVKKIDDKLSFHLIDDKEFLKQMAGCRAYASTAGFESICEAMYLGKPVLMVPSHIEQEINAFDAKRSNAGVSAGRFDMDALLEFAETFSPDNHFVDWVRSAPEVFLEELTENLMF
ncbi:MAG: glycosyltransferase [Bacteroidales bacterium]|nr:glycosyltransferase [Bacteroidales bacterium]